MIHEVATLITLILVVGFDLSNKLNIRIWEDIEKLFLVWWFDPVICTWENLAAWKYNFVCLHNGHVKLIPDFAVWV